MHSCKALLAVFAAILVLVGAPSAAQKLDVKRLRLPNGLTALALEDRTLPSVALHIVYRVGSRNERPGLTGLSHLFEHMMFNGSAHYPPKQFDRVIEAGGGSSNAFTTSDTTEYYEEFSSATLDAVLRMEADRMRALKIDRANVEQERGIVKEERRANTDNSPEAEMWELLENHVFRAYPYRWDTIGFMKDIDAIRVEDARAYFATYYAPNNAVIAAVGDFDTATLFAAIRRYFGSIPRRPAPRPVVQDEPVQRGEVRVALHRPAELPAVLIGYHGVALRDPADAALDILSVLLASGESSRLYRSLVYEKQVAAGVSADNDSRMDPGLFAIFAQAQPGHTAAECEAAIYAALEAVQRDGVTERELRKAKNMLRVGQVGAYKTNLSRAGLLAGYEAKFGDWRRVLEVVPRYEKVTAADVQRAARRYLTDRNRTVVTLIPEKDDAATR
jgi:predicted Zn-dependent peptidase